MFKKIIFLAVMLSMLSNTGWAQGKYSIKEMTPEVREALDARKERFSQLRSLKSSGVVGENNHGYVEAFKNDSGVSSIIQDENHDRQILYKTIAEQNGLQGALSTIESAFAQVQREKAESGDKIQTEDGGWIAK